jgi:mono/diheme cytochrome c family protein
MAGPGVVRYAAYADLLRLPQTSFTAAHDSNFSRPTRLGGVSLDALLHALGEDGKGILIAALCDDLYEAHYTEEYRRLHDPVLVLRIEGRQPAEWARTGDEGSYGPYLISHAVFKPEYRALTHVEEAQIPNGVLELRFLDQATVLKAIAPVGEFAADSPQMQGYQLAFENCFRCHNQGEYGGRKARRSWNTLAAIAGSDPASFRAYVKNPQAVDAKAQMPGNPDYDRATLDALTAYFRTFAGGE